MASRLRSLLGERLQTDEPLAKFTVARLGGVADYLFVTQPDDPIEKLAAVAQAAWDDDLPVRIIGGGANILVSDAGVRGLTIINKIGQVKFGDWHDGRTVSATSGTNLIMLARQCQQQGISGMEWAISVPGSVGGAVVNNAGAHGSDMSDSVADVVVMDAENGVQLYTTADLAYDYRYSTLKARKDRRFAVLLTTLILPHDDPKQIQAKMDEFKAYRKETQPPGASLGSIFKNPKGDYAGRLIEQCGLKGYRIGNVQVSSVHANFFINIGDATATEYFALIEHVRAVVYQETSIMLEIEIELVGDWA